MNGALAGGHIEDLCGRECGTCNQPAQWSHVSTCLTTEQLPRVKGANFTLCAFVKLLACKYNEQ